jgi:hypothetical protein
MQNLTAETIGTEELARLFGVKPESIRHALCQRGHYFGLKPLKRPNRLLAWDRAAAEAILRGERPASSEAPK